MIGRIGKDYQLSSINHQLNKYSRSRIALPEFFRGAAFFLFKNTVEIGDVVKPAVVGYFCNGLRGIDQHTRCMAKAYFGQAVDKGIAGALFEKPAERHFRHIGEPRHFSQGNGLVEILVHIFKGLLDAAAVVRKLFCIVERRIGQDADIARGRQIVQDGNKLQHRIEAMFLVEPGDAGGQLLRGFGRK